MKRTNGVASGLAVISIIAVWAIFWNALTFNVLWNWFAVDAFNINEITVAQACGLWLIITLTRNFNQKKVDPEQIATLVMFAPIRCATLVSLGWLIKAWV